jgi:hypothetical protein
MSLLIANWFGGEFGWELMSWVPAVRRASRKFDKTVVICRTGHDYLYRDFASKIEHWDKGGRGDRWLFEGKDPHIIQQIVGRYPGARVITPNEKTCTKLKRSYVSYGKAGTKKYELMIHARAETKYGSDNRNWPKENYVELLNLLGNPKAASIGTKAMHIPGTTDLRRISMERLCNILAGSKLLIGPSSGPMHLGHLCRCPILVWTGGEYQKSVKGTNRERYEAKWRPFKDVPVTVVDKYGWRPPVDAVAKAAKL